MIPSRTDSGLVHLRVSATIPVLLLAISSLTFFSCKHKQVDQESERLVQAVAAEPTESASVIPTIKFGIEVDSLEEEVKTIRSGQIFRDLTAKFGVSDQEIYQMVQRSAEVFDIKKLKAGKPYHLFKHDSLELKALVYRPTKTEFVTFEFGDSVSVRAGTLPTQTVMREVAGTIEQSLDVTLHELGYTSELTNAMVDVFSWVIDFNYLDKGDRFKIIFEEEMLEGKPVGFGNIKAALFESRGVSYPAYAYNQSGKLDYFDEQGQSLRKAFLKYPIKFTRISSRYSSRRFHPVLKRNKSHLGTDFAAPRGTEIRSVGDGVISKAGYTRGNGKYVKVKHNGTYSTQYLHMSRIGKGIKAGSTVKQGQVIGYVGSTGLATGPHLCFRFWKKGRQVDGLRVELPAAEPIIDSLRTDYDAHWAIWKARLKAVSFPSLPSVASEAIQLAPIAVNPTHP